MPAVEPAQSDSTDRVLLLEAQAGSVPAFNALVDRHYNDILYYFLGKTDGPEDAYDLVQETFLDTFRALDSISGDRTFRAWLVVTARNNLRHRQRQGRIRRIVSLDWLLEHRQKAPRELTEGDLATQMVEEETLRGVLAELSPPLRIVLEMVGKGYSIKEAAEHLGISHEAARQRVSRAMRYVRDRYDELGLWTDELQ